MDEDIARALIYALSEPERVDVNEILIRPASQAG
jgi:NADP-dependent 3-hydroxy acid dehydrogenase YdfG